MYSSSSDAVAESYFATARQLGEGMAKQNYTLIYGGAAIGLMGAVARSVHQFGGKVVGVIPESLQRYNIAYEKADELIVTTTMRERKTIMEDKADAFIALPGGFGTLEELLEIITAKQLQLHNKPIVIINRDNFYAGLMAMFNRIYEEHFAKTMHRELYFITDNTTAAIEYIAGYVPKEMPKKWF